jgi:3-oxoacyl-[acyl-carrier protein] reductase
MTSIIYFGRTEKTTMNDRGLSERTVVVTGASKGIGRETAEKFVATGSNVAICSRSEEEITDFASELNNTDYPGEAFGMTCDVTEKRDVVQFIDATVAEFGAVDTLVNNVGDSIGDGKLHELDESTWDTNFEINLKGTFLCSREVLPLMAERGGGSLVHISAINATTGIGYTAYSAAKNALHAFSRVVATQYGCHGIRSNVILPGTISTDSRADRRESVEDSARDQLRDQYPLGHFGRPEDIANAALYLGSPNAAFVTGAEIPVDGGLSAGLDHTFESEYYDITDVPAGRKAQQN